MGKMTGPDYQRMLEQAGDEAEQAADDQTLNDLIDQRLNALGAGIGDLGEPEAAAAAAEGPRVRSDGQVVGISEARARPLTPASARRKVARDATFRGRERNHLATPEC